MHIQNTAFGPSLYFGFDSYCLPFRETDEAAQGMKKIWAFVLEQNLLSLSSRQGSDKKLDAFPSLHYALFFSSFSTFQLTLPKSYPAYH